ncbi:M3 family metallopeptidase [Granulosicoccus antarcticus]|uniref:oligopeptidase A n=1 Tax=Granulosicoccus antarcticus IMCC3135 TaxID=1192854 RepID=A0A2Z2NFQ0_9GAMM|nr:M3 family metallopeptidase [Granulosicoccus antarcticus]ASJ70136.1 Oligopeptidase A [Granulosicoccus antarcticus IMCC3135]
MSELLIQRPDFSAIDVDTIEQQLEEKLADCRSVVATVSALESPDWDSLVQPMGEVHNRLSLFWSPISHLNSVMNNDQLREVYNRCLPTLSTYYTELGQNSALYNATLSLKDSAEFAAMPAERQQQIHHELRDFELGGVSLEAADKKRYGEIALELSRLTTEFSDSVLDATNAWEKLIADEVELDGLPASAIAAARQRAKSKGQDGYLLNLEFPSYIAVMMSANNRELRQEVYTAFSTRASDQGPNAGQFDNSERIEAILSLRAEKATLLGFESYAHLSVVPKMVETPQQVLDFLDDLAVRAQPAAREEFAELKQFAANNLNLSDLAAWDITYASDRLKKHRHDLSDEELKPYFPADRAVPGMFAVIGKLFGLEIKIVDEAVTYHPDVNLYAITDSKGNPRGEFYMDNYARENKRGGAWMDVCATRQRVGNAIQQPIAYLTCNLTPPVGDDPALLTHQEVTTLFHEFGHGLHHMLTQIETAGVSGINGVEWDAVELPSQFLENWCWERESIDMISGHYQTGEPLPDALLEKMRNARNFQSAMQLVRQLEFSLFDMHLHLESRSGKPADVQATLNGIRQRVAVVPVPEFNRFQHSFSHIFAGGYSAGYFSYKWAEVLSADAFSRFEEEGIFNETTGQSFLENVLEVGGSRDAMTNFAAFRGREPQVDALLRHSGLA